MTDPDWWSLIDPKAAMREQFPSADVVRATERVSLGNLHTKPAPAESKHRIAATQERNAEMFIARMEERMRMGAIERRRLAELSEARAVKRREQWMQKMRERGLIKQETA